MFSKIKLLVITFKFSVLEEVINIVNNDRQMNLFRNSCSLDWEGGEGDDGSRVENNKVGVDAGMLGVVCVWKHGVHGVVYTNTKVGADG